MPFWEIGDQPELLFKEKKIVLVPDQEGKGATAFTEFWQIKLLEGYSCDDKSIKEVIQGINAKMKDVFHRKSKKITIPDDISRGTKVFRQETKSSNIQ